MIKLAPAIPLAVEDVPSVERDLQAIGVCFAKQVQDDRAARAAIRKHYWLRWGGLAVMLYAVVSFFSVLFPVSEAGRHWPTLVLICLIFLAGYVLMETATRRLLALAPLSANRRLQDGLALLRLESAVVDAYLRTSNVRGRPLRVFDVAAANKLREDELNGRAACL